MQEKTALFTQLHARLQSAPQPLEALLAGHHPVQNFQAVNLTGIHFYDYHILLDNQTNQGKVGYRWLMPAAVSAWPKKWVLIDRGWVSHDAVSKGLPPADVKKATVGYVRFPSHGLKLSDQSYAMPPRWPLVVQWVDTAALGGLLQQSLEPFVIQLDVPEITGVSPEKHLAYAVQWFIFAALTLVYAVLLSFKKRGKETVNEGK